MFDKIYDFFIIGGGINGCGIVWDVIGCGLLVVLVEMNDFVLVIFLVSIKLFYGGLWYLEYFEFCLVKEVLEECEILLCVMFYIFWLMCFVLFYYKDMWFDLIMLIFKFLIIFMFWMKGCCLVWFICLGFFMYDNFGGCKILFVILIVDLIIVLEGILIEDCYVKVYEYFDCWV